MSLKNDALIVAGVAVAVIAAGWYAKKKLGEAVDWVYSGAQAIVNEAGQTLDIATSPGALNVSGTVDVFKNLNGPDNELGLAVCHRQFCSGHRLLSVRQPDIVLCKKGSGK